MLSCKSNKWPKPPIYLLTRNCPFVVPASRLFIGRGIASGAWGWVGRHCKPRRAASHSRRVNRRQTGAGMLQGGCAADCSQCPCDWLSLSWRRRMRCMLLHRQRGSVRGCCGPGPSVAPWPETPRKGPWRPGSCTGWGPGPTRMRGPTPQGSCSERLKRLEGMSAGDAKMNHCGKLLIAPEMRTLPTGPKQQMGKKHALYFTTEGRFWLLFLKIQGVDKPYVCSSNWL